MELDTFRNGSNLDITRFALKDLNYTNFGSLMRESCCKLRSLPPMKYK